MGILKKNMLCFTTLLVLLLFTSCGFSNPKNTFEKFLNSVKYNKVSEMSDYLVSNENSEMFKDFMESIFNLENSDIEFMKLNKVMLNKVSKISYEIVGSNKQDKNATINVKFKYFNLFDAYKGALDEFLAKALDFENLDELYNSNYITELLIKYINNLPLVEKELTINLVNDDGWKIVMDTEFLELLTANSIKLVNSVKENIPVK